MNKPLFFLVLSLIVVSSTRSQNITRLDQSKISFAAANKKITSLMKAGNVSGAGITIFNNGEVVYKKTFGYKNLKTKQPIRSSTNFYGASLSKSLFAVLVMKLVEEGVLDLDRPLQSYLDKPIYDFTPATKWHDHYQDLKVDNQYTKITARMCLDHTTGFPNWRWDEPDQVLRIKYEPGTKYSYSGEGLVYLQVVLEKMLGKPLEQLMQEKIFGPLNMKMSAYSWQPRFESDYCIGHDSNGKLYPKDKDNEPRAASTLETTLDDYSTFLSAVLQNKILKPETRARMFSAQLRIRSIQQFGPLRFRDSTENDAIQLGYGLGWGLLQSPYGRGAFKEGHGDGFQHYTILFPEQGTGILILTNSDNGERIFKALLEYLIGDTFTPWYWENYLPYDYKK